MAESDSADSVAQSRPKSLAAFLAAGGERARLWQPDELGSILRHQMAAPVLVDLGAFDAATAARLKTLTDGQKLLLKSFADLLHHAEPPLELLELTKDFAKANMDHPESALPAEVASVLYYASIASALTRLGRRITRLPDAELRRGLNWARGQVWIDAATARLLDEALAKIPSAPAT